MKRNIALLLVIFALFINGGFTAFADASMRGIEVLEEREEFHEENVKPLGGRDLKEHLPDFNFFVDPVFSSNVEGDEIFINTTYDLVSDFLIEEKFFDHIKPGDYLEYPLGEYLDWPQSLKDTELKIPDQTENEDGEVEPLILTLKLVEGALRVVFSDLIDYKGLGSLDSRLEGGEPIRIKAQINKEKVKVPQEIVIKNPFNDEEIETIFIKPENRGEHIKKSGSYNAKKDEIIWVFDLNKGYENLVNAALIDNLPPYLSIVKDSIVLTELELDFELNEVSSDRVIKEGYSIMKTDDPNGFKLEFNESLESPQTPKRLVFKTRIDEEALKKYDENLFKKYFLGEKFQISNKGELTYKNKDKYSADANVTIENAPVLEKKMMTGKQLNKNQVIEWQIKFNNGNKHLEKPIITDTISENLEFIKNDDDLKSIFRFYDKENNDITDQFQWHVEANAENPLEVKIVFDEDVDETIVIKYNTKVKKEFIVSDVTVSNSVSYLEHPTNVTGVIKDNLLVKRDTAFDHKNKTINWEIKVNQAGYELKDLQLTDTLEAALTFIEESLEIKTEHKILTLGQDYELSIEGQTFKINFINDYAVLEEALTIYYQTHYDRKQDEGNDKKFSNDVLMTWDGGGDGKEIEKTVNHKPVPNVVNNGAKSGTYNYRDKKITWEVFINYNQEEGPIYFEDIIKNQKVEAVDIFEYEIENNKEKIISDNLNQEIKPNIIKDGKNEKVTINFNDGKQYLVVITTSVADGIINAKYTNNAKFITKDNKEYDLEATINIAGGGSHGDKSGKQIKPSKKNLVEWTIDINRAQSRINNVVISDEPSYQQEIMKDSFTLFKIIYNEKGAEDKVIKVDDSEYDLEVLYNKETGQDFFKLSFKEEITNAYRLTYRTRVYAEKDVQEITNKIKVDGEQEDFKVVETIEEVIIESVELTGGLSISRYPLKVCKMDAATNEYLKGAAFTIEFKNSNGIYVPFGDGEVFAVDDKGCIELKRAHFTTYRFTEVKTPEGYLKPIDSFEVEFTKENYQEEQIIENEPSFVKIHKIYNDLVDSVKEDSKFELYQYRDNTHHLYHSVDLEQLFLKGEIEIKQLPVGKYRLKEIEANASSVLNTKPLDFKVVHDETRGTELYYKNDKDQYVLAADNKLFFSNYQGSVVLKKTDEKNQALSDAFFDLYYEDKLLKSDLKTDEAGQIHVEGLSPGSYYFKESKAPIGYIKNEANYSFEIAQEAEGKPETVRVDAINYQAQVAFKKVNENKETLANVPFELYKVQEETQDEFILDVLSNSEGIVSVDNLGPGKYYFKEKGHHDVQKDYILNTETLEFEIPEASREKVILDLDLFTNYQGKILIQKVGEKDEALANVHFKLYDEEAKLVREDLVTDGKGELLIEGLAPGKYQLKEVQGDELHLLEEEEWNFEIKSSHQGQPKVINRKIKNYQASVSFQKINEVQVALAKSQFSLYYKDEGNDQLIGKYTSNDDGLIFVDGLAPGSYYFKEIQASNSYLINTELLEFEIEEKATGKLHKDLGDFINYQGSVVLKKTDEKNQILANAVFDLYYEDKLLESDLKTDEAGQIHVKGLSPGSYYFKESKAPAGYIKNEAHYSFEIAQEAEGRPEAISVEAINYRGSASFIKTDQADKPLSGVAFGLYVEDQLIETVKSDSKGIVLVQDLEPGRYYFKEIKTLEGYLLNTEKLVFDISDSYEGALHLDLGNFINYKGSVQLSKISEHGEPLTGVIYDLYQEGKLYQEGLQTDKSGNIHIDSLAPGQYYFKEVQSVDGYLIDDRELDFVIEDENRGLANTVEIEAVNYLAQIIFRKVDENKQPVADSKFVLYDLEGHEIARSVSNKEGLVIFDDVKVGNYKIKEVETSNYLVNLETIDLEIEDSANGKLVIELDDFINYQGHVLLEKQDESGHALEGVIFDLYSKDHQFVAQGLQTDANGQIYYDGLAPGKYYFKEVRALDQYLLNERIWEFEIEPKTYKKPELIKIVAKNYQALASFRKVNEFDEGLEGMRFEIYRNQQLIDTITSDAEGLVRIDGLEPGSYLIKEVDALNDYLINTEIIEFEVPRSAFDKYELVLDDFVNYRGSLEIHKLSPDSQYLDGARFKISSKDQVMVKTVTNGKLLLDHLKPGYYDIEELEAPTGYQLNSTVYQVMIRAEASGKPAPVIIKILNHEKAVLGSNRPSLNQPNHESESMQKPTLAVPETSVVKSYFGYMLSFLLSLLIILFNRFKKKQTY